MNPIYKRRSIRKYLSTPIPDEKILEFIKAGLNAPSAGNQQPWKFLVINQRAILNKIIEFHPHSSPLKDSPVAILVCGDLHLEVKKNYWMIDCAAATQNILLEIANQDYGACWLGVYPRPERMDALTQLFDLPENIMPFSLIAVGVPAEEKEPNNKFDLTRIKFNSW